MKKHSGLAFVSLLVAACNGGASVEQGSFQITETPTQLAILGEVGGKAAQLTLEKGRFASLEDEVVADGRKLVIRVGAFEAQHVSGGFDTLRLPLLSGGGEAVNEMVQVAEVQSALARWGVTFDLSTHVAMPAAEPTAPVQAEGETPYACDYVVSDSSGVVGCGACSYGANSACGFGQCKAWSNYGAEFQYRICNTAGTLVNRMCTGNPGGYNSCGAVGPLGCSVCWGVSLMDCNQLYEYNGMCAYGMGNLS